MILQYTGDNEGWYYFFENKEVYNELAANEAYVKPDPAILQILYEKLLREPEQFQIRQAAAGQYFHFRLRCPEAQKPEAMLPWRILYYPWDDEGYFYMVGQEVYDQKTGEKAGITEAPQFETIPLEKEKELLQQLDDRPDQFDLTKGTAHDFFYQKFRIKSL